MAPPPAGAGGLEGSAGGALVVDKPAGLTSHDVVAAVRRALGEPRAGHTGTLDPSATGVLPVLIGRATRLARFLSGADKVYEALVSFTGETETDDAAGAPVEGSAGVPPSRERVEEALAAFRGAFMQVPPAYSAKKVAGRRAYEMAREAIAPPLDPVPVVVRSLILTRWEPPVAALEVECSAGFYVRALARDLGRAAGAGAHLAALRRVASGRFHVRDAVPLDLVVRNPEAARARLLTPAAAAGHLPAVEVPDQALERARHGGDVVVEPRALPEPAAGAERHVRLVAADGALVGIAVPTGRPGVLHPVVVLM